MIGQTLQLPQSLITRPHERQTLICFLMFTRPDSIGSLFVFTLETRHQKEDTMLELLKERELDHYGSGVGWLADLYSRPTPNKWMIIIMSNLH